MASRATADGAARYTRGAIAFHWAIAALIIVNVALGILHEDVKTLPLIDWHKAIGMTVLALSIGRWLWRLGHRPPPLPPEVPGWQKGLAHGLHWLFYLLIVFMPLSGWWFSSAGHKYPLSFFGLFVIPDLPVGKTPVAGALHQMHVVLGWAMVPLVLIHIAAALYHHLVARDATLVRMWPSLRTPAPR